MIKFVCILIPASTSNVPDHFCYFGATLNSKPNVHVIDKDGTSLTCQSLVQFSAFRFIRVRYSTSSLFLVLNSEGGLTAHITEVQVRTSTVLKQIHTLVLTLEEFHTV